MSVSWSMLLLTLRVADAACFMFAGALLFLTAMLGRYDLKRVAENKRGKMLEEHRGWATITCIVAFGSVVFTEVLVRLQGGIQSPWLFRIHLSCFAVPFAVSLILLRSWITGLRFPRLHGLLALLCCVAYVGTFATGITLLFKPYLP